MVADYLLNFKSDQASVGYEQLFSEHELINVIIPAAIPLLLYYRDNNELDIKYLHDCKYLFAKPLKLEAAHNPQDSFFMRVIPLLMKQAARVQSNLEDMKSTVL